MLGAFLLRLLAAFLKERDLGGAYMNYVNMNYVKLLNAFEDYSDRTGLPTYAQVIYYKLFAINNRAGWAEWFEATNPYLMFKASIKDEKTFERHRNTLKQCNLIDFLSGKKSQPTKYKLIKLYTDEENTGLNPVKTPPIVPVNMPGKSPPIVPGKTPDIYKLNGTKFKEKNIKNNARTREDEKTVDNFSVCPKCGGKGFYYDDVPYNNGMDTKTVVIDCDCKKKKPAWADRLGIM